MLWLALYIAAMFLIALPVAWFSRNEVAGVVFVVWGVGQVAHELGVPEPQVQILLYGAAFVRLMIQRRRHRLSVPDGSLVAVALFVPLLLVCWLWWRGNVSRDEAWWPIWCLAMIQAAFLLRPIAWPLSVRRWHSRKSTVDRGGSLMVIA